MTTAVKSIGATLMAVLLLAGAAAVAYARWTRSIADADQALAGGQWDWALAGYADAEARFDRIAPARAFAASDYERLVGNELWLLYRLQRYDDLIDKAERAPDAAAPHFWSGLRAVREGPQRGEAGGAARVAHAVGRGAAPRRRSRAGRLGYQVRLRDGDATRPRAPEAAQDPAQSTDAAAPPAAEDRGRTREARGMMPAGRR